METRMLFQKYRFFDLQQHAEQQAKQAARALPEERLAEDDDTLVSEIVAKFTPVVPLIDASRIDQTARQVEIDARSLPNRLVFNRSRPVPIPGTEITIHVPFSGDANMFDVCPSCHTTTWPNAAIDARNNEIQLIFRTADEDFPAKARCEEMLRGIRQYLDWLRADMTKFESLRHAVQAELRKRRQAASAYSRLVASTGIPMRPR